MWPFVSFMSTGQSIFKTYACFCVWLQSNLRLSNTPYAGNFSQEKICACLSHMCYINLDLHHSSNNYISTVCNSIDSIEHIGVPEHHTMMFLYVMFIFMLQIREDWKFVAMVVDRLQLYIFFIVTTVGTIGILMDAPHIFEYVDQDKIIDIYRGK